MKLNPISAAIIFAVVVGGGIVIFQSDERPDVLPAMAGCFEGPASLARPHITISPSGEFATPGGITTVSIHEDKLGLSLLPEKQVIIDRGRIWLDAGHPSLLRISPDRRSFLIEDGQGPDDSFERIPCA